MDCVDALLQADTKLGEAATVNGFPRLRRIQKLLLRARNLRLTILRVWREIQATVPKHRQASLQCGQKHHSSMEYVQFLDKKR